jgi:hypothetical protein
LGLLVQATIIGFAMQGKAQISGADLVLDYTVPPTGLVGNTLTNTATIVNLGPNATGFLYFQFTRTPGVDLLDASAICTPQIGADFVGFDCPYPNLLPEATLIITATWRTLEAGPVVWQSGVSGMLVDPIPDNDDAVLTTTITSELSEADILLDYTLPLTATVGAENTNTAVVTNLGPDTASILLFQFTRTPGLVTLLDIATSQGTCVENSGAGFSGFDCDLGDILAGNTVTTTLTWVASAPGVVEWEGGTTSDNDPDNDNNFFDALNTTVVTTTLATAEPGPNQPEDTTVDQEALDVPLLQYRLSATTSPLRLVNVTLNYTGTFSANEVLLNLYMDTNGDGQADLNDLLLRGNVPAVSGELVINYTTAITLTQGTSSDFLISACIRCVSIQSGSNRTRTAAARSAPLWPMLLGVPVLAGALCLRRYRKLLVFVLVLGGVLWLTTACPSDDDEEAETFAVTLQNVGAINPNNGAPVTINGLPITGATITVQP